MNHQLAAFCEFPNDLKFKKVQPNNMPACDLFTQETDLFGEAYAQFNSLLHALAPVAYQCDTMQEPTSQRTSERLVDVTA